MIQTREKVLTVVDEELAPAVLALPRPPHPSAEYMGHELHAIADAQGGDAHPEKFRWI
jgi:hypothetical protein